MTNFRLGQKVWYSTNNYEPGIETTITKIGVQRMTTADGKVWNARTGDPWSVTRTHNRLLPIEDGLIEHNKFCKDFIRRRDLREIADPLLRMLNMRLSYAKGEELDRLERAIEAMRRELGEE